MKKKIIHFSTRYPKLIAALLLFATVISGVFIFDIKVDTDPENMLSEDEYSRVFHDEVKHTFGLSDFVILGVVNEGSVNGVYNVDTLNKIYEITKEAKKIDGVVAHDLMSLSTVDNITQAGPGSVRFEWLMGAPVKTEKEARAIRDAAMGNPMLNGTLVSEDGMAAAIYIPIESKDLSYKVAVELKKIISSISDSGKGSEEYHITGLPVAEDTFGIEMFKQMAVSAPMAGLIVFLLMLFFFKSLTLVIAPMIVAIASIVITMGMLIGMGHTVHIMSSMIPIFLMPIAVVDSVHILSEFFDHYNGDRRATIASVMETLFTPMFYTSITSAVGFASLALTPIPPVQVFGIFISFGIMLAWVFSVFFIPAYVMLLSGNHFKNLKHAADTKSGTSEKLSSFAGDTILKSYKTVIVFTVLLVLVAGYGITRIKINDNPVKWFEKEHPIRIADAVLNKHFGGTYTAYLVLKSRNDKDSFALVIDSELAKLDSFLKTEETSNIKADDITSLVYQKKKAYLVSSNYNSSEFWGELAEEAEKKANSLDNSEELSDSWYMVAEFFGTAQKEMFKRPEILKYVEKIQEQLQLTGIVGKSTSIVDVVKKVYFELMGAEKKYYTIPASSAAVAQTLISFQNSHNPDDLWHMVTPDYSSVNIWVQLTSGDNTDMEKVVNQINSYIENNPAPLPLDSGWAGLTYINVKWQEKMVAGMLNSLAGSFVMVLILMIILFRSFFWGFLAMVPLSVTIVLIYGMIGLYGKDYDMPIAVLSSLTLGLSVDFAIHFLERARAIYDEQKDWKRTVEELFSEPARAISRNAAVISIGFTPLLFAPLVPYKTVGFFLASIMVISGIITLVLLPSIITPLVKWFFQKRK